MLGRCIFAQQGPLCRTRSGAGAPERWREGFPGDDPDHQLGVQRHDGLGLQTLGTLCHAIWVRHRLVWL
ncbi:hypothetical protein RLO149_c026570 [Roseobacter litoralis Och 149]|uniref:Uncharacterized protein n=1 Tax=Roseobacter litoralis (strain ATCC 49566 / DSM 6996 / JCM 21268 / NBRC 15278 / OCh 149) TaxID=391595 RepID=F7ZEA7_ROSLO|nr:hypothetical protein RLO149_c026570 [Roseobacter litoralis Och 149]